ncbi:MAG: hypothetical protein FWG08_03650 [Propionibacteriaceae bacterium]|nr:hypothetical protein [Propionibacteriaceae bacterium]
MDTTTVVSIILLSLCLILLVVAVVDSNKKKRAKQATEKDFFQSHYGSSVDRMLAEFDGDKDALRTLRDSERSGPAKAVRELKKTHPVSLQVAADFIKRL